MNLTHLLIAMLVTTTLSQPAEYLRCRLDCATDCGKNGTACVDCTMSHDCTGATEQVCVPKNWNALPCPSSCGSYDPKTMCGIGCVTLAGCGTQDSVCVPNGVTTPCPNNGTCVRWNSCDRNKTAGAQCCPAGQTCNPANTYIDCGDCNVVQQKYLEAVCHLEHILPLWQWALIGGAAILLLLGVLIAICCCCCKSGKGPQSIEDEEWLLDDNNRW